MRKKWILILVVLLLGLFCWWFLRTKLSSTRLPAVSGFSSSGGSSGEPKNPAVQHLNKADTELDKDIKVPPVVEKQLTPYDKKALNEINRVFGATMSFYGKVVDQNGDPVADASVLYAAADKYFGEGSKYHGKSDINGLFSITNIKGSSLYVEVSKSGYYRIPDKSYRSFANSIPEGDELPTSGKPAIFELRKIGNPVPLIKQEWKSLSLPNGSPADLSLHTGKIVPAGGGDITFEYWTDEGMPDSKQQYSWKCRISVPGGGLVERTAPFDFEAPTEGYRSEITVEMPHDAERWRPNADLEFFFRLRDGTYARAKLTVSTRGAYLAQGYKAGVVNMLYIQGSYLNPTGDRNLEAGPDQIGNPK